MAAKHEHGLVPLTSTSVQDSDVLTRHGILEIIAVHGLPSGREATWTRTAGEEAIEEEGVGFQEESWEPVTMRVRSGAARTTCWLKDVLPAYLPHARVWSFGYEVDGEGFSAAEIEKIAVELLDALGDEKMVETANERTFVFVGHDLGGCVIKQALLIANAKATYSDIAKNTSLLVFFGTPHRAANEAEWEVLTYKLTHAAGQKHEGLLSDILKKSSFALRDINKQYAELARIYNVISICEKVKLPSLDDLVVDTYAAQMGIPSETVAFQDANHLEMGQIISDDDELFHMICGRMRTASAPDPKHVEFLHTLSFLDCSHPIPTTSLPPSLLPTWILMPENFLAFLQSHQPLIVHLHSASAHSYSALSSFLYTHVLPAVATINNHRLLTKLNTKPAGASTAIILAFSFATQDVRARSTAALFAFLTRQLLQQAGSMRLFTAVQHLYVSVAGRAAEASWQAGELWQAFQTVLAAVGRARAAPVYCVIDAVEKCDVDRREFLGDFWRLAEARDGDGHRVLKIIVTGSVASAGVGYALPAALVIDVDAREEAQENVEDYVGYEIARLAEARPAFRDLVEDIRAKILAVKPDVLVALLMCKWFLDNNAPSTPTEIQSVVDGMPQSLAEIYRQSYLKTRPYASRWDLKALYWIAHALQPLVLEELATATAVESSEGDFRVVEGNRPRCLAEDLKRAFGCFLDFHGDEVFLVHESAREFLLQSAKDWDPEGNSYSLAGHARIAGICINYLLLKDWEQLTSDYNEIETLPPREGTSSLLGYAAKYWHVHYGLAEKNQALFEKALSFLENTERRELWSQLEWLEGNKLASKRDTSDPELVAAELGLNDVLLSMIDKKPDDDHLRLRALEIASGRGDKALIDQLVERGVAVTESLALHHAAQTGQLGIVTYLLQNGAKVDAIDESNWTALFFASENGYLEIAVELLRNRANPNWKADKLTPLHLTAEFGNIDICRKLIEEDADVNASDENGLTPLHMATLSGQLKIMEMLLDHEAEIDCKDDTATRPLHQAASSGITEAVKLLVARNATLNATDDSGKTALYLAVEGEFSEIVQVLVGAKADINIAASEFGTPLHAAAIHGNLEIAMQLLDAGADLHIFNDSNFTVLHLAARYGHTSLVRTFLEDGAHVDESNAEGQTALQLAASNGNFGALQALINFNASVNVVNEAGWTPMAYVARRGDLRSVKALLAAGAEVDPLDQSLSPLQSAAERGQVEVMWVLIGAGARTELEDMEGDTPLHCAVKSGSVPAVQVLLDKKVNINAIDTKKERTPLLEAAILGYPEIVNLLLKVGANAGISDKDGSHFLHFAVKSSSMETLNLALDSSHDILVKDESDRIPLHVAAETGFTDGVERLLKVGHASAQIKATTAKERTHLHLTAKYGHLETAEALLKVGVDIEAIDEKHLTALHLATRREHLELAKLLVGKGADANKLDKDGRTPLFIAFEKGNLELIKLLFPKTRDIKAVNSRKETLLHLAVRIQFLDPVKDLIALGLDVNATNIDQSTPISLAVQYGNLDVVNALLGAKAKVNCVDKDERRALYWAIQSRENLEMVVAILETGEDPDEPGTMWPPMYTAAYFGKIDIVQEFLRRKLDVELCGSNGWAPLHAAFDNAEITRALLEAGAKVDPMNDDGNTPLHLAVAYSFDDTTRALLEKQADSLKRSKDGRTALHKAASAGNLEVMILMLNLVAGSVEIPDNDGNTPVWEAVNNGNSEVAQLLLERPGCDVNQTCGNKKTLLETALANEDLKTTELLIRRGAKITAADEPQLMTMAATEGNLPLVQLLLLQGVGVHETDAHGWTPEMLARAMNHVEVAEALKAARGEARDVAKALAPSGWSETKKSELLEVDEDGMGARHMRDPYVEDSENYGSVHANHPIPLSDRPFYYEIEILDVDTMGIIGVGLATGSHSLGFPGWDGDAWAYHGDDGSRYHAGDGTTYAEKYGKGDVIGCLYESREGRLSFTKNDKLLGLAFENVRGRLFPVVGLGFNAHVRVNFGEERPFRYKDLEWDRENMRRLRRVVTRRYI